jgi:CheY-like chemotaxis protein/HPt (histidine-containing phosphotransfer) domain-containing protein
VVDDNQTNRLVVASQLQAWNITVDVTANAEEALECLRRAAGATKPYDLAILDMAMPVMDGLELATIITADPELASVRLLLLSSIPVEAEAAARAGFEARLTKPVRLSSLYDALVRAVSPSPAEAAAAVVPSPLAAPGSRGMLLVVEDNAINQEVARGMAAKLGFGSDVAANGVEALEALERRNYDAVLMDCHMPEMDGFEATAAIRRGEAGRRRVPIIAMTAGAQVEDRERCLAAGMDDYLSKPVKSRALEAVLDRWLAATRDKRSAGVALADEGTDGHAVLDAAQLDDLRELATASGDMGILAGLVERYLDDAASQVAELNEAAGRGDSPAVESLAHGLKGSSATMGASGMASACWALEQAAARGDVTGAEDLRRVDVELGLATVALRAALV